MTVYIDGEKLILKTPPKLKRNQLVTFIITEKNFTLSVNKNSVKEKSPHMR